MVDLAPLFALGQSLVEQAVDTSGTVARLETRTTVTDPATLDTSTTATVLAADLPALVVAAGNANATQQVIPGLDVRPSDWKVILKPAVTPPPVGAWVVVTASRDPHQVGRDAKVIGHVITSAGAALMVYARPGTPA